MNYLFLILLATCVLLHIFMMSKGHKKHQNDEDEHKDNKHGGCCH